MREKKLQGIVFCVFLLLIGIIFVDDINTIQYGLLDYDGSYNATVAANVARHGEYRVSYPQDTFFDNKITTGELVLLPVAGLYKVFGISQISSCIVVLIYSSMFLLLSWFLIRRSVDINIFNITMATFLLMLLPLSEENYIYISTNLVGESACLFFTLLLFYMFVLYYQKKEKKYLYLCGVFLSALMLTKSSMIFIFFSFLGVFLIEVFVMSTIDKKDALSFALGVFSGWIVIDAYKFIQVGGVKNYLEWWSDEWFNMMNQSSGMDTSISISTKLNALPSIMSVHNRLGCIILIISPVIVYIIRFAYRLLKKKNLIPVNMLPIVFLGVCGSSLLIYFIIFGGRGLFYARRHIVNVMALKLFAIWGITSIIKKLYKGLYRSKSKYFLVIPSIVVVFAMVLIIFPKDIVINNGLNYIKKEDKKIYEAQLMDQFIEEINNLPSSAKLYCNGWWQEPEISLRLDKKMISIYDSLDAEEPLDVANGYFIVGRRFDGATTESLQRLLKISFVESDKICVDYNRCNGFNSNELFSIYKMKEEIYTPFQLDLTKMESGDLKEVTFNLEKMETESQIDIEGWAFITEKNIKYDIYVKINGDYYKAKRENGQDVLDAYKLPKTNDVRFYIHMGKTSETPLEIVLVSEGKYYYLYR